MDLVTTDSFSDSIYISLGSGTGTFSPAVSYSVSQGAFSIFPADFDGNGKTDVAIGRYGLDIISVLLNVNTCTTTVIATPNNTLICAGNSTSLTASGASSYTWNTGAQTSVISVSPTVTTTYTVAGKSVGCPITFTTITQNVSLCTGINSQLIALNSEIMIYPNPTTSVINIEFLNFNNETYKIELINTLGQVVLREEATTQNITLKTNNLNNGVYFIKLDGNKNTIIKKFIKQ